MFFCFTTQGVLHKTWSSEDLSEFGRLRGVFCFFKQSIPMNTHKNVLLLLLNVMHKRWYKSLDGLWSSHRGSRRAADIVFFLLSSPSLIRDLIGCLKSVSYLVPTKNATSLAKVVESEPEQPVILNRDSDIYFGVSPCDVTSEPWCCAIHFI